MVLGLVLISLRVRRRTGKLSFHTPLAESPTADHHTAR
jgi:hypothetical protein